MKVLFVYKYLTLGGCETVLRARLGGLREHGIEGQVHFLCDGVGRAIFKGVESQVSIGDVAACEHLIENGGFDLVSSLDTEEIFPFIRQRRPAAKLVVEVHSPYLQNLEYLRRMQGLPVAAYFVPSRFQASIVRERVGEGPQIHVVPNPLRPIFVDAPTEFRPRPERPVVAWVGRLDDLKNWREFVEVAGELHTRGCAAEFWIVGNPVSPSVAVDLFNLARQTGALDRLRWFRGVPHDRIPIVLDAVRASGGTLVSTSRGDSFGMTVAEGMARALPVVVPDQGPFSEFMEDQKSGLLYRLGSTTDAAEKIAGLLSDAPRRQRFGEHGRQAILKKYAPGPALTTLASELHDLAQSSRIEPVGMRRLFGKLFRDQRAPTLSLEFKEALEHHFRGVRSEAPAEEQTSVWLKYALGTNERGHSLMLRLSEMLGRSSWQGARVLDAGCAYAGLMRAFLGRGAEAVGVDVDGGLLKLASVNLDQEDRQRFRLLNSRLEDLSRESAGLFDLIVCDNVLEHVEDSARAIELLAQLLAAGGAIYVAVPNPFAPAQVKADPHFGLPGITLLPLREARRCYQEGGGLGDYSVGEYDTPEHYFSCFFREGLDARYACRTTFFGEHFDISPARLLDLEREVRGLSDQLRPRLGNLKLSVEMRTALDSALKAHAETFEEDRQVVVRRGGRGLEELMEWYGPLVWHFLAVRLPVGAPVTRPTTLRSQ